MLALGCLTGFLMKNTGYFVLLCKAKSHGFLCECKSCELLVEKIACFYMLYVYYDMGFNGTWSLVEDVQC